MLGIMQQRYIFTIIIAIVMFFSGIKEIRAQKSGYIDSEYILAQMTSYKSAKKKIDSLASTWEKEVRSQFKEVEKMKEDLLAQEVLLSEERIEDKQYLIAQAQEKAEETQQKVFGYEGLYFLKRKELLEVPQNRLWEAVEMVAKKQKLQLVFDKANIGLIYTDPVHDYTEYVLEELGLLKKSNTQQ